jgi:hypothetical protein
MSNMADVTLPRYTKFWKDKRTTSRAEHQSLVAKYPDADAQLKELFKILCDIEVMAGHAPASVGESVEWTLIVNTAEDNRASYCKALNGKPLFSALYATYTVTLIELKAVLKASTLAGQDKSPKPGGEQLTQDKGFKDVHRRKRHNTNVVAQTSRKAAVQDKMSDALNTLAKEVLTRNYFAPLGTAEMGTVASRGGSSWQNR